MSRERVFVVGEPGGVVVLVVPVSLLTTPLAHEHVSDGEAVHHEWVRAILLLCLARRHAESTALLFLGLVLASENLSLQAEL